MSNILQKEIPRVKELCESLGFRTGSDRPHFQLADHTHEWRRHFTTDDGIPGTELKEWRNPKHQNGLESMTQAFLENRGEVLWPASTGFLEYQSEQPLIASLVKQLFWRQNTNEARNAPYYLARDHARDHPDHQGDDGTRHRRSIQSPSPNIDSDGPSRFPPAAQLSGFRATTGAVSSQTSQSNPDEPESDSLLWRNPDRERGQLTEHTTAIAKRQTVNAEPKRSNTGDRKDDWALAPERKNPTVSQDRDSIYSLSSDNEDSTASWGAPKKQKASPKSSSKRTTPKKGRQLPGAQSDHDSDDLVPRDKKRVKVNNQKTQESPRAKPSSLLKLSPRTTSGDKEKLEARRRIQNKDEKSSESRALSMRKTSTGSKAHDQSQGRDSLRVRLSEEQQGDAELVQTVNTRPKDDASAQTTTQSNKVLENRPSNLPSSTGEKANTSLSPQTDGNPRFPRPGDVESSGPDTEMRAELSHVEIHKPPNILPSPAIAEQQITTETLSHQDQAEPPAKVNNLNSTVKREDPSRSPSGQPGPDRGHSKRSTTSNATSGANIRFTIIKARHPRLQKLRWSNGSLGAHNVRSLFREISELTGRTNLAHITFKLMTSCADNEIGIQAGDDADFRSMQNEFLQDIRDDIRQTKNREFLVELTLNPEGNNDQGLSRAGEEKKEGEEGAEEEEDDELIVL